MKRTRINVAAVPRHRSPQGQAKITTRRSADSMITGYGSAIDIPRTSLAKGGKFGETIAPQALTFAVRREPVAKKLVMDVSEDMFDKWFTVRRISKKGEPIAGESLNESVQTALETLNAKLHFIRAVQYERRYGWSILVLGYEDEGTDLATPVKGAKKIDHLAAYSPRSVTVDKEVEGAEDERFGLPLIYKIDRGKNKITRIHYTRVLHIATRLDEHAWAGTSVLEPVWDDITVYRNMRWAAGQVYWRTAGLMVFTLPKEYTADKITAFFASLGDPNSRTFVGLPNDKKLEMLGVKGRVPTPEDYVSPILRSISMGSGIPKQKLEGVEAGAIAGSEVNQREYYKYVSGQQKLYEAQLVGPLIDLLMKVKQVKPDTDYSVDWISPFQMAPSSEAAVREQDARAATLELNYSTVDEVREKRNIKPLKDVTTSREDGRVLLKRVAALPQERSQD